MTIDDTPTRLSGSDISDHRENPPRISFNPSSHTPQPSATGNEYSTTNHNAHSFHVVLSLARFLMTINLPATTPPSTTGATYPATPSPKKAGQAALQNNTGPAVVHLTNSSPNSIGAVVRPRAASPTRSLISRYSAW
jgi:hypothetical protein